MKIIPPKELMPYVTFRNGELVVKGSMPVEYTELLEKFREDFKKAKALEKEKLIEIYKEKGAVLWQE